jgi:hypothetical protein
LHQALAQQRKNRVFQIRAPDGHFPVACTQLSGGRAGHVVFADRCQRTSAFRTKRKTRQQMDLALVFPEPGCLDGFHAGRCLDLSLSAFERLLGLSEQVPGVF